MVGLNGAALQRARSSLVEERLSGGLRIDLTTEVIVAAGKERRKRSVASVEVADSKVWTILAMT